MHQLKASEIVAKYLKYMENIELSSPLTLSSYAKDLSQAFPTSGDPTDHFLSPQELFELAQKAQIQWGSLSRASRNRKAASLKSFFQFLFREGLTEDNFAEKIVCPRVPKKIPHFLSLDECLSLISLAKKDESPIGKQKLTLLLLLYGGGLRISEACSLCWEQINFHNRSLRIIGKGNKERIIVLPEMAISALRQLQHLPLGPFGENALNSRLGFEWIRQLGRSANLLRPLNPHALRHSFATHLLSGGANLRTLQELLGHSSLSATEKYTHMDLQHLANTLDTHHPFSKISK